MRRIAMAVVLGALVAWPATLPADDTTSGPVIQSLEVVSNPTGGDITFRVRRADGTAPPLLTRLVLDLPRGTGLHAQRFPRCDLARIQAKGPSACTSGARVGTGALVARSDIVPKRVGSEATLFNGEGLESARRVLLMHVRPELGPTFVLVGKWRGSSRAGLRLDLAYPTIRILAGIPPEPSPSRISLSFGARRGDSSYLRAPCRGVYGATAYYVDGSVVKSSDRARCA
jgi:hypothetical protein